MLKLPNLVELLKSGTERGGPWCKTSQPARSSLTPFILIGVLGLLLILVANTWPKNEATPAPAQPVSPAKTQVKSTPTSDVASLENWLELRLSQVLQQIDGIGDVSVSVTLASGPEYQYAVNQKTDKREITEKDERGGTRTTTERNEDGQLVLVQQVDTGKQQPLVVKEMRPLIKGVLVVATGARDARVREELTHAVQTVLDIPAYKIKVLPKKER